MKELELRPIGKHIDQLNGFAFKSELFNQDDSGIRLCRGINITRGKLRFDSSNEMFWSDESIDLKKYLLEQGDIVISMDGSLVGRNYAIVQNDDLPLLLVQRVARLRAKEGLSQGYLYQWIASDHFIKYVDSVKTSSGIPHISASQINEFTITFLPLPEQQKIASILSKWDETIEAQTQLIEAKEKQKKGLMQKLLTGEVRFPGFEGEWEAKRLNEILTIGGGRDYKHLGKGDIPVYGSGGYMTSVDQYLIDGETVCIGRKGTIDVPRYFNGKIWTVDTLFYCHSFMHSDAKFVYYLFQSINWKDYNEASGVPSLSKSTIGAIEVKVPLFEEQIKIASILNCIDVEIQSLKIELEAMKLQKKGLMQELLTGKIRVKN